ncbi:MAG TPA: DUF1501 domain-containing protein [Acidimicrobiales bacterium]|nr:DUF1501 domain-containing protein [Acidimicrobiales bacterium]
MNVNRRQFMTGVLGGGIATGVISFTGLDMLLSMSEASASTVPVNGPFVLCTLYGGNDGLNTVIPYESAIYRDWRGELAVPGDQVLPLGEDGSGHLGLHPSLQNMHSLWKAGKVAIINGVEYPDPNFSHFASQSIWQTCNLSGDPDTGWLGRWLDTTGIDPFRALSVGSQLPPALVGAKQQGSSVVDSTNAGAQVPGQNPAFSSAFKQMMKPYPGEPYMEAAQATCGANLMAVGNQAADALSKEQPPNMGGAGDIGTQLSIVAELIEYGLPTSVYSVGMSGFDTHSNQANIQPGLLSELDDAIGGFMSAFPEAKPGKSPVVMIYSEFGRTTHANASAGTDHSSASSVFVVGPAVKGGFYGDTPSFTHLDPYGNLIFTTDYRRIYATVLEHVLGMERPYSVLRGSFRTIDFL